MEKFLARPNAIQDRSSKAQAPTKRSAARKASLPPKTDTGSSGKSFREIVQAEKEDAAQGFPIVQYGARLRQLRLLRKLSLSDLAARSVISVGMLSHIERGQVTPSLNTVDRIRKALGLPMSDLLLGVESGTIEETSLCVRKANRLQVMVGSSGLIKELLSPLRTSSLEMMTLVLPPQYDSGSKPWARSGEKAGVVMEGCFELTIGEQVVVLEAGDSFQFDATIPHHLRNLSDSETRVLWIINAEIGA